MKVLGISIISGLLFLLSLVHPHPTNTATTAIQPEKSLIAQVNEVRAKAGKPPLREDPLLNQDAQLKVDDQVTRNYWEHHLPGESTFQFITQYPGRRVGENIAKCQTTDSQRVGDWTKSPSHYAGMVGDYEGFGSAEKVNPKDHNCIYTVTEFIKYQ